MRHNFVLGVGAHNLESRCVDPDGASRERVWICKCYAPPGVCRPIVVCIQMHIHVHLHMHMHIHLVAKETY